MAGQLWGLFGVFGVSPQRVVSLNVVHVRFSRCLSLCKSVEGSGIRRMETKMKKIAKIAVSALALAGVAAATTAAMTAPAEARVAIGIGIGGPGYYGGYYGPPAPCYYGGYYGCGYGPAYYGYGYGGP